MSYRSIFLAASVLLAVACTSNGDEPKAPAANGPAATAAAPETSAKSITLLVTGDNWGEIAPCG